MTADSARIRLFVIVFAILCGLTAASFALAQWVGTIDQWIVWSMMMAISAAKAGLVISFYMHLKWEKAWKWILTVPALLMGLVLTLSLIPDVGNRNIDQQQQSTQSGERR